MKKRKLTKKEAEFSAYQSKQKWTRNNKEKVRKMQKAWREAHPNYGKAWREAHPDYYKEWNESHPDYYTYWRENRPVKKRKPKRRTVRNEGVADGSGSPIIQGFFKTLL